MNKNLSSALMVAVLPIFAFCEDVIDVPAEELNARIFLAEFSQSAFGTNCLPQVWSPPRQIEVSDAPLFLAECQSNQTDRAINWIGSFTNGIDKLEFEIDDCENEEAAYVAFAKRITSNMSAPAFGMAAHYQIITNAGGFVLLLSPHQDILTETSLTAVRTNQCCWISGVSNLVPVITTLLH